MKITVQDWDSLPFDFDPNKLFEPSEIVWFRLSFEIQVGLEEQVDRYSIQACTRSWIASRNHHYFRNLLVIPPLVPLNVVVEQFINEIQSVEFANREDVGVWLRMHFLWDWEDLKELPDRSYVED